MKILYLQLLTVLALLSSTMKDVKLRQHVFCLGLSISQDGCTGPGNIDGAAELRATLHWALTKCSI